MRYRTGIWRGAIMGGLVGTILAHAGATYVFIGVYNSPPTEFGFRGGLENAMVFAGWSLLFLGLPLIILAAGLGAVWVWVRRRRRIRRGLCPACGYDLRGTAAASSARCPECGQGLATQVR